MFLIVKKTLKEGNLDTKRKGFEYLEGEMNLGYQKRGRGRSDIRRRGSLDI